MISVRKIVDCKSEPYNSYCTWLLDLELAV